jgi:hypothetical protein
MDILMVICAFCLILFATVSLQEKAPPLPREVIPYPVVANIEFAEGPIFDSQGNPGEPSLLEREGQGPVMRAIAEELAARGDTTKTPRTRSQSDLVSARIAVSHFLVRFHVPLCCLCADTLDLNIHDSFVGVLKPISARICVLTIFSLRLRVSGVGSWVAAKAALCPRRLWSDIRFESQG